MPRSSSAAATLTVLAALLVAGAGWTLIAPETQDRLLAARYPVRAADRLLEAGCDARLLNAYDWGGYLLHRGLKVGAYGDVPGSVVARQAELEAGRGDPLASLDALEVEVVLVRRDGPLAAAIRTDPAWRVVAEDSPALLAVRRPRPAVRGCRPSTPRRS